MKIILNLTQIDAILKFRGYYPSYEILFETPGIQGNYEIIDK